MKKLVTILTPTYNSEKYINRFLESVVKQTYNNIQLIIVDDGSIDKTGEILSKFAQDNPKLNFKSIYQKNGGQASAVSNGIKFVEGEYLVWADSDDFFEYDAIELMVNYLEKNKEFAIVRCNAQAVSEENVSKHLHNIIVAPDSKNKVDLFEDYLFNRNVHIFAGVYMMRFKSFKENNPKLIINKSRQGQNYQLLLPILYNNKCGYLDKIVYNYVVRKDSHSHAVKTVKEKLERIKEIKILLSETLKIVIKDENRLDEYSKLIDENYYSDEMYIYSFDFQKEKVKEIFKKIKNKSKKDYIFYLIGTNKFINKIYRSRG